MPTRASSWSIRPAERADAAALAAMANALNVDHGHPPGLYSAEMIATLAFGPPPNLGFVVAEATGTAAGYASFQPMFDSDTARMGLFLVDLYVAPEHRGLGIGRGLMQAAAAHALEQGLASLWWGVMEHKGEARRFYQSLGAEDIGARFITLAGPALEALATDPATVPPESRPSLHVNQSRG